MSQIDRYVSRMTMTDVWPAAHSAQEAADALADTQDLEAPVLRWYSNGQCPMDDMLAAWLVLGLITRAQADATSAQRAIDSAEAVARYRAADAEFPPEELYELRAAFGPGETVVNVVTGREIRL